VMFGINKQSPTVRELAHVLSWTSSKVHRTLLMLRQGGHAKWEYNKSRTLTVRKPEDV